MSAPVDLQAVERAAAGLTLKLPRVPHRGRLGEVRASSVGSSLELHDFREYQPGDDLRHIDWNAVARTGALIVRVRQDEVSPRVEVVLDGSASMSVSPEKAARAKELALWACSLARHGGLEPVLTATGRQPERAPFPAVQQAVQRLPFDGGEPLDVALRRAPPLLPCGLRVVVSDFLFESAPETVADRLARGAAALVLVQVLDAEDLDPSPGTGVRLVDSETGERLERILTEGVLESYRQRFRAHVALWQGAARRVRAQWVQLAADRRLDVLVRAELSSLVEAA